MSNKKPTLKLAPSTASTSKPPRKLVRRGVLQRLARDERGMSTIEYVILMAVIVVGAVGLWNSIGKRMKNNLKKSKDSIHKVETYKPPK